MSASKTSIQNRYSTIYVRGANAMQSAERFRKRLRRALLMHLRSASFLVRPSDIWSTLGPKMNVLRSDLALLVNALGE